MNKREDKSFPANYRYKPDRAIVLLVINSLLWTIIFFVSLSVTRHYFDIESFTFGIKMTYWVLFAICVFSSSISIFANTKRNLLITADEIIYTYGLISKSVISIPVCRIRSSEKHESLTQRFFGSSTFCICTAGDDFEISFFDMENAELAQQYIRSLTKHC